MSVTLEPHVTTTAARSERRRSPAHEEERVPAQARALLALQRAAGNQAVTRLLGAAPPRRSIQRKVDDIPMEGLAEALPAALFGSVDRYSTSPKLDTLEGPQQAEQRKKDSALLAILIEKLQTHLDTKPREAARVESLLQTLVEHQDKLNTALVGARLETAAAAAKETPIIGPIGFATPFPAEGLAEAPRKSATMFSVDYIEIVVNDTRYRLFAGQKYLNPGQSARYQAQPDEIKPGAIPIYSREVDDTTDHKEAVVGDFHHRFVWTAYHGRPLTAELKPRGWASETHPWRTLTYVKDPKNEYEFAAKSPVTDEVFVAAVSPVGEFRGRFAGADRDAFLLERVRVAKKNSSLTADDEELGLLAAHLQALVDGSDALPYEAAVAKLMQQATNVAHSQALGRLLLQSFPSGRLPVVALGPTQSTGYFSAAYNVIVLDPSKNKDADALLDTLAFETGNALHREDFLKDAALTTQIEFEVTDGYVRMLMEATRSGSIDVLVRALGIDERFLVPAHAGRSLAEGKPRFEDGRPAMPDKAELAEQYKRTALWHWKQQAWSEDERLQYFAKSAHGEGMEATAATYDIGAHAVATTATTGGSEAMPSYGAVLTALSREYPRTGDAEFRSLEPRHLGEFLMTGRVDKWHTEPEASRGPRQDVWNVVLRDLATVYPNESAWRHKLRDVSYTDLGEFVLYGRIRAWEDRELLLAGV